MYLLFAIDAGEMKWLSAHETRDEAVEHLNWKAAERDRPDFNQNDAYEFMFVVESAHFASFV